ncbi:GTP cyclohydrolase FolE2 [Dyella amyloliquefaciens]|uniref:GTP cyclohydrolase FolE2 n=1 Tax=Dyella amyloliquefaciens TaxID=1770545 RepID=UPI00102ED1D6|nr:GTP cyclohydrolase FolE2 [Dyella amyloliquefaciens]
MKNRDSAVCPLPDIGAHVTPGPAGQLDWVGMEGIALPVCFDAGDGNAQRSAAKVDAFVNLVRAEQRGIHMSRLYLLAEAHLDRNPVDAPSLEKLLRAFLHSHEGLADRAHVRIRFDHLVRRPALRSHNQGWRAYPVSLEASISEQGFQFELGTEVVYSSTCPASAALSRQLIQRQFAEDFPAGHPLDHASVLAWLGSEQGIVATPHAQRSTACLRVRYAHGAPLQLIALLDRVEHVLGTPVQTAVKREDEQAFALANGGNLMFCEDAARRIQRALENDAAITGFKVRVAHHESLHPHDAVAYASGGSLDRLEPLLPSSSNAA